MELKPPRSGTRAALGCAVLFVAYFVTARLGLLLGAVAGFATLVWPPTGIALAALYLFGFRLWPGVLLGAFFVNFAAGAPIAVAFGIASGNTLEAIAGARLLGRVRFQPQLDRISDVLSLIIAAVGFGPFAQTALADSLLDLQAFMGVVAATALVLGAAIAERNRAVEARDEFLSIASHELRTPLTALSLHLQTLLRGLRRSDEMVSGEEMRGKLESANRLLTRVAKLINELLDISRVATGRFQLHLEEVDLATSVRESLARFQQQLSSAGCPVDLRLDGRLTGRWDPLRLDQVIDNLLSNAAKYGAGKPVEVWLSEHGERVVLEVRDHGIGIDPADQSRIFGQFERAVSHRRFGGFGLGLWITRRVIEAHGGTIRLTSAPGLGSTFTVELPR